MKRGREEDLNPTQSSNHHSTNQKEKKKKPSHNKKQLEPKTKKKKATDEKDEAKIDEVLNIAEEDHKDESLEKKLGKKELQKIAIVKRIIDTIYGSDETQLVIFIFNFFKYCGKKDDNTVTCSLKDMTTVLKKTLPRLQYLLSKKFIEQHSKELNVTEIKDETITAKPIFPYFSNEKDSTTQEFKDRLITQLCSSFIGILNVNSGDFCQNIGNIYSNTNYFGLERSKYVEYVTKLLDNKSFVKKKTKNGFMIWNNEIKNKLSPITEKKNLIGSSLPDLDYSDKLIIVSKVNKLERRVWNLFMDKADQTSIFVVDTEWNFNDDINHGIRLLQISTLDVCLVLLVDFKQPIPNFLLDFFLSPTILKIGYSLGGDLKKINNWLLHHNNKHTIDTNLLTDLNVNEHGWVEGDPLVFGLQKLLPFCAPKIYHKFENSLKYNDLIWNPKDMRPSTSKGNIRIEYAALDVLAGFFFFKHNSNPSSNLFRIKMQIPNFEKQIEERSERVKGNLLEFFESGHHHYEDYTSNKHNIPIKFHNQ